MSKPEWGIKRTCQSCAIRFYDLNKKQINCPKCGANFDPEAILKPKRGRASDDKSRLAAEGIEKGAEETDLLIEDVSLDGVSIEDDNLLEDTADLEDDEVDVIDGIEGVDATEEE